MTESLSQEQAQEQARAPFPEPPASTGTVVVAETGDGKFAQYLLDGRQLAARIWGPVRTNSC